MTQGKADNTKRIVAALIDGIIAGFIYYLLSFTIGLAIPFIGGLLAGLAAAAYIGLKDAIPIDGLNGSSPGKALFKQKAIKNDGGNCDYETSIKRNLPFVVPYVLLAILGLIPLLGPLLGLILMPFILIIYIVELIFVLNKPTGERWGDTFAGTRVIDLAPSAAAAPPPPPEPTTPPADPPPAPEEPPAKDEESK